MEELINNQAAETTMEDTIASSWERIQSEVKEDAEERVAETAGNVERDAAGKFSPKEITQEEAPAADDPADPEIVESTIKAMPASWRKEISAHWDTLPDAVKDEVIKRENDVRAGFQGYKAKADLGSRFEQIAKPYEQVFKQFGVAPEQAAQKLFNADYQLRYGSAEQKQSMLRQIARDYAIELPGASDGSGDADPRIANMEQRIAQYDQERQTATQQRAQQEEQEVLSTISGFAYEVDASTGQPKTRGTDEYGNPVLIPKAGREHFEAVRNVMAGLIQGEPSLTLEEAYDRAVYALPTTRQALLATQQAAQRAEEKRKAKLAKDANVVNIQARGIAEPKAAVGSMDSTILDGAKRLGLMS